jgi:hypothetical protein
MSEFERRIKELWARITGGLSTSAKTAGRKRDESSANLRREAAARAQQAAAKARDLRDSETAKKAASALHDLRQREPVKKAEESARKVLHDLFSGGSDSAGSSTPASGD